MFRDSRLAIGLLLAAACTHAPSVAVGPQALATRSRDAALFLSSDLQGYLTPCGCSANMRGGIDRAAAQIKAAQAQGLITLYADAGNSLFGHMELSASEIPQEELKARLLAQALRQLGIAAKAVGPLDSVRGESFLAGLGLPLLRPGSALVTEAGGGRIGFVLGADLRDLTLASAKARNGGAQWVVGFWTGSLDAAQRLTETHASGVDLLVASAPGEGAGEDNRLIRTPVPLLVLQDKGRSLARLDIHWGDGSSPLALAATTEETERAQKALTLRIELLTRESREPEISAEKKQLLADKLREVVTRRENLQQKAAAAPPGERSYSVRFIPLEATLPTDPAVHGLLTQYDAQVAKLNLEWANTHAAPCPVAARGEASYVGNAQCESCHEEASAVFRSTRHARAYQTLVEKQKQYRLDCVGCHVLAYQRPGGVCRINAVKDLGYVGCESCHGPGSLHVDSPSADNIRAKPGREQCLGCHNPENSPAFDFALYLPHILGRGHGLAHE